MTITVFELSYGKLSPKLVAWLAIFSAWMRTLTGWRAVVMSSLCLLAGSACFVGVFYLSWHERAWKRAIIAVLAVLMWWAGSISWLLLLALWLILTARA